MTKTDVVEVLGKPISQDLLHRLIGFDETLPTPVEELSPAGGASVDLAVSIRS
jgi:hypothetical protein